MAQANIDYRDCDRQVWEEELEDFVPSRILDAHIHCFWRSAVTGVDPDSLKKEDNDLETLNQWAEVLYPGRRMQYLILGHPFPGTDVAKHVELNRSEIDGVAGVRHNRLVTPSCKLADIERDLKHPQFVGLKPYRTHSITGDIAQCRIHEFLPHEQMEFANHHGLWVTMHLSRFHGCADHLNLQDLEEYTTKRYPNLKWLLAHCARSFTYWPMQEAVERLRDMPNIHYDTSAVTEAGAFEAIVETMGHEKLMYGTDFHVSQVRGRCVAIGDSFHWLYADEMDLDEKHISLQPVLIGLESLRSLVLACNRLKLSERQVEDIFYGNAATLLGVE